MQLCRSAVSTFSHSPPSRSLSSCSSRPPVLPSTCTSDLPLYPHFFPRLPFCFPTPAIPLSCLPRSLTLAFLPSRSPPHSTAFPSSCPPSSHPPVLSCPPVLKPSHLAPASPALPPPRWPSAGAAAYLSVFTVTLRRPVR